MADITKMTADLKGLIAKTSTPEQAEPKATETTEFHAAEKKKSGMTETEKQYNTQIVNTVNTLRCKQGSLKSMLLSAYSRAARICGYVVTTDSRFDIYSKTNKDKQNVNSNPTYDIGVKNFPPSKIVAAIIKQPISIKQAIDNYSDDTADAEKIESIINGENAVSISTVNFDELPAFLMSSANGYLAEADEIFTPFYAKNKKIKNVGDAPCIGAITKPALMVKLNPMAIRGKKRSDKNKQLLDYTPTNVLVLKHTFRSRIATPKNIIALRRFETLELKSVYPADEAAELNTLYLGKYAKVSGNRVRPVLADLTPASSKIINFDSTGVGASAIKSSAFFPTDGAPSYFATNQVTSWFEKTENGEAAVVPTSQIKLVKKVNKSKKEGEVKPGTVAKEIKDTNASEDAYKFDPNGEHKAICDAADGMLTFDVINGIRQSLKRNSKTSTANVTVLAADQLAGADITALVAQINTIIK